MTAGLITIVFALVGFAVFFFIVKRMVRMAVRLALVGAILFALLVGAIAWWWYAPLGDGSAVPNGNRQPATSRPARQK